MARLSSLPLLVRAVLLALALAALADAYVPLAKHSLVPPFDNFKEHSGERQLLHWKVGGHAAAKHNFIRLTEDKQSRRGNVFNTERFDLKEFGLQLKFRISGSGKHLYGDGLGLWLTKKDGNPRFEEGPVLGHTDMFTGIGILLDTFRNVESGHVHKDVSLIVSAGTEPVIFDKERPGCDAHYRYFEGREDFDVDNASMIRMWLEKNRVSLEIDRYAKGDWKKCVEVDLAEYKLPANWQDSYHWSISASTGALADNHDVLEFKTASPDKFAHLLKAAEDEGAQPSVQIEVHPKLRADEVGEHVNDLAYEVSDIDKSLRKLSHKMEHDLETVKNRLESMLKKLEEKEDGSRGRIEDLETKITTKLTERVGKIEEQISTKLEARLQALEIKLGVKIDVVAAASTSGGSYKLPLFFLVVVVSVYMAWSARSLRRLQARDKLI